MSLHDKDHGPVVLITRVRTSNQGNQALSMAWVSLLRDAYPSADVGMIERGPTYLTPYRLADFEPETAIEKFEQIVSDVLSIDWKSATPAPMTQVALLDCPSALPVWRRSLLRMWRSRRLRNLARVTRGPYARRLALFDRARLVVSNPAGEFQQSSTEVALVYLLELRIAQRLGCKTALVNITLEADHPILKILIPYVCDMLDLLEVRDHQSAAYYKSLGGKKEPIILPDAAILTKACPSEPRGKSIAVAINSHQVRTLGNEGRWKAFLLRLQTLGYKPALVTNEWISEEQLYQRLSAETGVPIMGQLADYEDYASVLATFDAVMTSRLHSAVLSLAGGVPVIPMEPTNFKMKGFFDQMAVDARIILLNTPDWEDQIEASLGEISGNRQILSRKIITSRDRWRDTIRSNLSANLAEV